MKPHLEEDAYGDIYICTPTPEGDDTEWTEVRSWRDVPPELADEYEELLADRAAAEAYGEACRETARGVYDGRHGNFGGWLR